MTNPTPEEMSQWLADLAKDEPDVAEMMSHGGRTAFLEGGWYSESDVDVLLTLAATEHHKVTEQSEGMARLQENKDQLLQALAAYEEQVTEQAKLLEEAREVIQRAATNVAANATLSIQGAQAPIKRERARPPMRSCDGGSDDR